MIKVGRHSRHLRIWHWLNALVIISLLSTFFLRKFLASQGAYFLQRLRESGFAIEDEIYRPILRDRIYELWTWHVYFGYVLTILFTYRMILFFKGDNKTFTECKALVLSLLQSFNLNNLHHALVKAGYLLFYFIQFLMISTGLLLVFSEKLAMSKAVKKTVHASHEFMMWFVLVFVIAHIIGVFISENTDDPGIVSSMINGGNKE